MYFEPINQHGSREMEGEESKGLIGFREKVGLYETGQDKEKRRDLKVLKRRGYKPDIKLNVCQS